MYFWSLKNLPFSNISISYNREKKFTEIWFDWSNPLKSPSGFTGFNHVTNQVYIPVNCFKLSVYILIILCREIKLCIDRSWWRRVAQLFTSAHSTGKSKYSRALFWSYIAGTYTRVISDPLSSTLYRICYLFNSSCMCTFWHKKIC